MNGWRVAGFNEVGELGAGAQGRVVLAVPQGAHGGGQVAIKYLAPTLLTDERSLEVFRREAGTLARVANPHVARLYQYVEEPHGAAIVMEAVAGVSLREVLDGRRRQDDGALAPEAALTVLKGSLLGLAAAHAVGVVHRDYKPANVVVQPDGTSKLIDFGIAVLSGQSSRAGTPAYMAPEQWQGSPASPATDLYAASCVFFECLTGAKPYRGGSTAQLMAQHLNAPVPLEAVPEPVRPLLARGLAKNPGQRLWNAVEFAAELERGAVAAYGPDWERRGIRALAVAVAALASAAGPAAMLGSFAAEGAAPASTAPGAVPPQQSVAAHSGGTAARHGRGFVRRVGGTKTIIGAAAVVAVAAATAGALVLRQQAAESTTTAVSPSSQAGGGGTPTPTTVGGQVTGQVRVDFRNPRPFGTSRSPTASYDFTVEPARVKPGSKLTISVKVTFTVPPELIFLLGDDRAVSPRIGFFPIPPASEGGLPAGTGTLVPSRPGHPESQVEELPDGWVTNDLAISYTARVPAGGTLRPGRYLASPYTPLTITRVTIDGKKVSPASVGARTAGSLPVVTVLPGTSPKPPTSSPPSTRKPADCPTYTRDDGAKIIRC